MDSPEFLAFVEKVKVHITDGARHSDLLIFLRQWYQQRSTWKKLSAKKAAEAFMDDQADEKDLMKKLRNGTEYDDLKEPDDYQPGQVWCDTCDMWVEPTNAAGKPHKHTPIE